MSLEADSQELAQVEELTARFRDIIVERGDSISAVLNTLSYLLCSIAVHFSVPVEALYAAISMKYQSCMTHESDEPAH